MFTYLFTNCFKIISRNEYG